MMKALKGAEPAGCVAEEQMCVDPPEKVAHGHGEEQIKEERVHNNQQCALACLGRQGRRGLRESLGSESWKSLWRIDGRRVPKALGKREQADAGWGLGDCLRGAILGEWPDEMGI
jgi:hypothetical protein